MAIPITELSGFFDLHSGDMRRDWEQRVEQGAMSEWTQQRHEILMDEISLILRMLAEGHATLTYVPPEQREPAATTWLPRVMED